MHTSSETTDAWTLGYEAARRADNWDDNPFNIDENPDDWGKWFRGFFRAECDMADYHEQDEE